MITGTIDLRDQRVSKIMIEMDKVGHYYFSFVRKGIIAMKL